MLFFFFLIRRYRNGTTGLDLKIELNKKKKNPSTRAYNRLYSCWWNKNVKKNAAFNLRVRVVARAVELVAATFHNVLRDPTGVQATNAHG